ncbi:MAG: M23 family metallopeptidase [Prevotellaceae bacterium]|nr:M23 family metallopeptidase [Prevotellaceae bacterium]
MSSSLVKAQLHNSYVPPMHIPLSPSSSFAELRPHHLHSGVDFRTNGKEGEPVYAVANGYIARIVVRPNGYGRALYIIHGNGTMSVYAHLQSFAPQVEAWVKNQQYQKKEFFLDREPDSSVFKVKQDELIGLSGNSGRSFGAHLHFEIRDKWQVPFNIISRKIYSIKDNIPPFANRLFIYRLDSIGNTVVSTHDKTLSIRGRGKRLQLTDTIMLNGPTYFGLDMQDRINGSSSRMGVYSAEMFVNDQLYFALSLDKVSFDEARYANAFMDCNELQKTGCYVSKLYLAPGNRLGVYSEARNRGVVELPVNSCAKISIVLTDDTGNTSTLNFWVKTPTKAAPSARQSATKRLAYWATSNVLSVDGCSINIPFGALYESCLIELQKLAPVKDALSSVYRTKTMAAPPHKAISVSIKNNKVPAPLIPKTVLVRMDNKGKIEAQKVHYKAPYFTADARSWGDFFLMVDTVAPAITPVNFAPYTAHKSKRVTLKAVDALSGLKTYNGYVDDRWVLFEYDEKYDLMYYDIDESRTKTGTQHTLRFIATDAVDNKAEVSWNLTF